MLAAAARKAYVQDRASRTLSIFEIAHGSIVIETRSKLNDSKGYDALMALFNLHMSDRIFFFCSWMLKQTRMHLVTATYKHKRTLWYSKH